MMEREKDGNQLEKNLCSFLDVKQFYFKMNVLGVMHLHSQTDVLIVVFYDR